MRKSGPRVRSGDISDIAYVSELRDRTVRALRRDYAHVLADPVLHKRIVTFLYLLHGGARARITRLG
jgi:hypothetical protein